MYMYLYMKDDNGFNCIVYNEWLKFKIFKNEIFCEEVLIFDKVL